MVTIRKTEDDIIAVEISGTKFDTNIKDLMELVRKTVSSIGYLSETSKKKIEIPTIKIHANSNKPLSTVEKLELQQVLNRYKKHS